MPNLTDKELSSIEDQLYKEQCVIKKYKSYAQDISDPRLKMKCEQYAAKHQEHYTKLLNKLN